MSQLSQHFTLEEAVFSSTALRHGVDNTPSDEIVSCIKAAVAGMESVRHVLHDFPIHIDSWYRCGILNGLVGGAKQSAHMTGYAIDFICPQFGNPLQIVNAIIYSRLAFDQCIQEGNWIHISFAPAMRQEVLTAHFDQSGIATYTKGVV